MRPTRWALILACSVALGAYLTLGELRTSWDEPEPNTGVYVLVSAFGIALLVGLAGWHSLWLMPVVTIGFASLYEAVLWTRPPGVGEGMDYISFYPTSVFYGMIMAVPYAGLLAAIRTTLKKRERFAWAPPSVSRSGDAP